MTPIDFDDLSSRYANLFSDALHEVSSNFADMKARGSVECIEYSEKAARFLAETLDLAGVTYDIELAQLEDNIVLRVNRLITASKHTRLHTVFELLHMLRDRKYNDTPANIPKDVIDIFIKKVQNWDVALSNRSKAIISKIEQIIKVYNKKNDKEHSRQKGQIYLDLLEDIIAKLVGNESDIYQHIYILIVWLRYQWSNTQERLKSAFDIKTRIKTYLENAAKCVIGSVIVNAVNPNKSHSKTLQLQTPPPIYLFRSWKAHVILKGSMNPEGGDDIRNASDTADQDSIEGWGHVYNVAVFMVSEVSNVAFISIKGTTTASDWEKNLDSVWYPTEKLIRWGLKKREDARGKKSWGRKTTVKHKKPSRNPYVSRGFYLKILSIITDIHTKLEDHANRWKGQEPKVVISGHSLGGAQAILLTYYINMVFPSIRVTTVTAGAPRTGADVPKRKRQHKWTDAFAEGQKVTNSLTLRLSNFGDIVPAVPVYSASEAQEVRAIVGNAASTVAGIGSALVAGPIGIGMASAAGYVTGSAIGSFGSNIRNAPSLYEGVQSLLPWRQKDAKRLTGNGCYRHVGTGLLLTYYHTGTLNRKLGETRVGNKLQAVVPKCFMGSEYSMTFQVDKDTYVAKRFTLAHSYSMPSRHLLPAYREYILQGNNMSRGIYVYKCTLLAGPRHKAAPLDRDTLCSATGYGDFAIEGCPCISDCDHYNFGGYQCKLDRKCVEGLGIQDNVSWSHLRRAYYGKCFPDDDNSGDYEHRKEKVIALREKFKQAVEKYHRPKDEISQILFDWVRNVGRKSKDTLRVYIAQLKEAKATDNNLRTTGQKLITWLVHSSNKKRSDFRNIIGPGENKKANKLIANKLAHLMQQAENFKRVIQEQACTHNLRNRFYEDDYDKYVSRPDKEEAGATKEEAIEPSQIAQGRRATYHDLCKAIYRRVMAPRHISYSKTLQYIKQRELWAHVRDGNISIADAVNMARGDSRPRP